MSNSRLTLDTFLNPVLTFVTVYLISHFVYEQIDKWLFAR